MKKIINKIKSVFKNMAASSYLRKFRRKNKGSIIARKVTIDKQTVLEGANVVAKGTNISSSYVGYGTVFGDNSRFANCKFGRFCSIAGESKIEIAKHPIGNVSTYGSFFDTLANLPFGKSDTKFNELISCENGKAVNVGNDVWMGINVIVKGGVTIHDGAVIGMGAVVTKDVPPYAVVGGVPAKVIKYRFDEDTIQKLLKIKWWDWDVNTIKERRNEFGDISSFVKKYYKDN